MKKSIVGFWVGGLLILMLLISSPAIAAEPYRIGALYPFTGNLALLGNESFNGATIAEDMVNEKGGINGRKMVWVKADGVDPKKAMTECERLIAVEKVKIITGTYSSSLLTRPARWPKGTKSFTGKRARSPITSRPGGLSTYSGPSPWRAIRENGGRTSLNEVVAPKLKIDPEENESGHHV